MCFFCVSVSGLGLCLCHSIGLLDFWELHNCENGLSEFGISRMKMWFVFVFVLVLVFYVITVKMENGLSEFGISGMKMWFGRKLKVISVPGSRASQDKC